MSLGIWVYHLMSSWFFTGDCKSKFRQRWRIKGSWRWEEQMTTTADWERLSQSNQPHLPPKPLHPKRTPHYALISKETLFLQLQPGYTLKQVLCEHKLLVVYSMHGILVSIYTILLQYQHSGWCFTLVRVSIVSKV